MQVRHQARSDVDRCEGQKVFILLERHLLYLREKFFFILTKVDKIEEREDASGPKACPWVPASEADLLPGPGAKFVISICLVFWRYHHVEEFLQDCLVSGTILVIHLHEVAL